MGRQVVEFGGMPMGVALPEEGKIKFMAVKYPVFGLDGRSFANIGELKVAIGRHLAAQPMAA